MATYRNNIVFILGNGRSGTHFVAELLNSSGRFEYNGEEEPAFEYSCRCNILNQKEYFEKLISFYLRKDNYIDKCHPNLWCAEELEQIFPNAIFVAVKRSKEDVVNSMMKHDGCLSWFQKDGVSKKFLGIEHDWQLGLSKKELCELRWASHNERINSLRLNNLFIFDYEKRFDEVSRIENYFGFGVDRFIVK